MMSTLASGFFSVMQVLGQLKTVPADEPRLDPNASDFMTLLMGIILVVGILLIAMKPSKRDRVQT